MSVVKYQLQGVITYRFDRADTDIHLTRLQDFLPGTVATDLGGG